MATKQELASAKVIDVNQLSIIKDYDDDKADNLDIEVERTLTEGDEIATIAINGTEQTLYSKKYVNASNTTDGLMAKEDKGKLDAMPIVLNSSTEPTDFHDGDYWIQNYD